MGSDTAAGLLRSEIEARLLAAQSAQTIAEATGVTPQAVEVYASVFFDVSDRLNARDWIVTMVLPDTRGQHGCTEGDIWRYTGWFCPWALDLLITDSKGPSSASTESSHVLAERIRLSVRVLLTSLSDPAFDKHAKPLADLLVSRVVQKPTEDVVGMLSHLEFLMWVRNQNGKRPNRLFKVATAGKRKGSKIIPTPEHSSPTSTHSQSGEDRNLCHKEKG